MKKDLIKKITIIATLVASAYLVVPAVILVIDYFMNEQKSVIAWMFEELGG